MKYVLAAVCLILVSVGVRAETVQMNGITVSFELPKAVAGPPRTEPFVISKGSNGAQQTIQIKFPGIVSAKYNFVATANLTIVSEPVPHGTATQDYFLHYFGNLTKRIGNVVNADDDILQGGLPGKFDGLVKNNDGGPLMYDYISAAVYKDVGFLVVFEITDDLYLFARPIAQEIIGSIKLK